MRKLHTNITFGLDAGICIVLAMMLLVLPLKWLLAAGAAAIFHECCHIGAVKLCGGRIRTLSLRQNGAVLESGAIEKGKEIFCVLAGPIGGLLLLPLARWIPRIAVCAAFHSLYNLLPIYPLDGGRALRCGMEMLFPEKAEIICIWVERCCLTAVGLVAIYGTYCLKLGFFPLLLAAAILLRTKNGKISCKDTPLGLQYT